MDKYNYEYLRNLSNKIGLFYGVREYEDFVSALGPDLLAELRTVYLEIETRGDSARISRWIDVCFENRFQIPKQEYDFSSRVLHILTIFGYLAEVGIQPFASRKVAYVDEIKEPNWSSLPENLHYIIDVLNDYCHLTGEPAILEFLATAREADLERLAVAAERIRLNGHSSQIDDWLRKNALEKPHESSLIHCFLVLMTHAGFSIE